MARTRGSCNYLVVSTSVKQLIDFLDARERNSKIPEAKFQLTETSFGDF